MMRRILEFHAAPIGWVAELDCGHALPLRPDRHGGANAWVANPIARAAHVGQRAPCLRCDDHA
ncbi:MAG TPA: DUF3565 domain-containing protein [Candidatus Thermoplasmatota archaeon]|jgi:hypothetical protein|nr:DUF3565 domain-containing protein [Candidatus Thermoplasmatota archaeon]